MQVSLIEATPTCFGHTKRHFLSLNNLRMSSDASHMPAIPSKASLLHASSYAMMLKQLVRLGTSKSQQLQGLQGQVCFLKSKGGIIAWSSIYLEDFVYNRHVSLPTKSNNCFAILSFLSFLFFKFSPSRIALLNWESGPLNQSHGANERPAIHQNKWRSIKTSVGVFLLYVTHAVLFWCSSEGTLWSLVAV